MAARNRTGRHPLVAAAKPPTRWAEVPPAGPLLGYTVDFLCIDRKLIVEIDGRQHCWDADYDAARTEEIELHGFKVVRFSNAEVVDDRDGVVVAIRRAIGG